MGITRHSPIELSEHGRIWVDKYSYDELAEISKTLEKQLIEKDQALTELTEMFEMNTIALQASIEKISTSTSHKEAIEYGLKFAEYFIEQLRNRYS